MHLKIINPNTTVAMTEGIAKAARAVAAQGAEIESCNPSDGPLLPLKDGMMMPLPPPP